MSVVAIRPPAARLPRSVGEALAVLVVLDVRCLAVGGSQLHVVMRDLRLVRKLAAGGHNLVIRVIARYGITHCGRHLLEGMLVIAVMTVVVMPMMVGAAGNTNERSDKGRGDRNAQTHWNPFECFEGIVPQVRCIVNRSKRGWSASQFCEVE